MLDIDEGERQLLLARLMREVEIGRDAQVVHLFLRLVPHVLFEADLLLPAAAHALAAARRLDDKAALLKIHHTAGFVLEGVGDLDGADEQLVQALELARRLGDVPAQAQALAVRGHVARTRGSVAAARSFLADALAAYRRSGHREGEGKSLGDLGNLEHAAGDVATAMKHYGSALRVFTELRLWSSVAHVHRDCCITLMEVDPATAIGHGLLAVAAYQRDGEPLAGELEFFQLVERAIAYLATEEPPLPVLDEATSKPLAGTTYALAQELPLRIAVFMLLSYDPAVWERHAEAVLDPLCEALVHRSMSLLAGKDAEKAVEMRALVDALRRAQIIGPGPAAREEAVLRERLTGAEAVEAAGLTKLVARGICNTIPATDLVTEANRWREKPPLTGILLALTGVNAMSQWQTTAAPSAALEEAIQHLENARRLLGPDVAGWWWLEAMRHLGAAYRNRVQGDRRQNHEEAIACLEQVLDSTLPWRSETLDGLVFCRLNLANALLFRITEAPGPEIERAVATIEDVMPLLPVNAFLHGTATLNLGLAYSMRRSGDAADNQERAYNLYYAAIGHFDQAHHMAELGVAHFNLALLCSRRLTGDEAANQEAALSHCSKAADLFERAGRNVDAAEARQYRATVLADRFVGDPVANLSEAIIESVAVVKFLQGVASDYDIAGALHNLGSLHISRARRLWPQTATGDLDCAEAALRRALAHRPRANLPREWAQTTQALGLLQNLRAEHGGLQARSQAIQHFRDALTVRTATTARDEWAQTSLQLAMALITVAESSTTDEARELLLTVSRRSLHVGYTIEAHAALGELATQEQDWPQAVSHYATAAQMNDQRYAAALLPGSQLRQSSEMQLLFIRMAHALMRSGNPLECALTLERARTRRLSDALERDRLDLERLAAADQVLHRRYLRAAERIRQASYLEPADLRPTLATGALTDQYARWADTEDARTELVAVEAAVRALSGFSNFLRPFDAAAMERVVAERGAVVYLAILDDSIWAIGCSKGKQGLHVQAMCGAAGGSGRIRRRLVSPTLPDPKVSRRNSFLLAHQKPVVWDVVDLEGLCQEIGRDLPPQIWQWIERTAHGRVTIVPVGILTLAPWHAAVIPDGSGRRLLSLSPVAFAPSARALSYLAAPGYGGGSSAFFGDPSGDLPAAREEAVELARRVDGSELWVGSEANKEAFLSAVSSVRMLHFAGHGRYDSVAPLESGIMTSDGMVTVAELMERSTRVADLIVLSACQTAVTDVLSVPDEAIGLPSAFLLAGANGVVASLWPVPDIPTRELMELFYGAMASGDDPASALRRAQLTLLAGQTQGASHTVRDWAGFVYIGG